MQCAKGIAIVKKNDKKNLSERLSPKMPHVQKEGRGGRLAKRSGKNQFAKNANDVIGLEHLVYIF